MHWQWFICSEISFIIDIQRIFILQFSLFFTYCKLHFSVINDHFIVIISISYNFKIHQLRFLFNDIMFCIFIIPRQVCIKEKCLHQFTFIAKHLSEIRERKKKERKLFHPFNCRHTYIHRPKQITSSINIIISFDFVLQKQEKY